MAPRRKQTEPALTTGIFCESCRVFLPSLAALRRHNVSVHKPKRFTGKRVYYNRPMTPMSRRSSGRSCNENYVKSPLKKKIKIQAPKKATQDKARVKSKESKIAGAQLEEAKLPTKHTETKALRAHNYNLRSASKCS